MIPELSVVRALSRLIEDEPLRPEDNGFGEPWGGIVNRLVALPLPERLAALESELKGQPEIDTGALLDEIVGTNDAKDAAGSVLAAALDYHRRGWCVVPVIPGEKRPAVKWQGYQHERPSEEQLHQWFDPGHGESFRDLAIVLGRISDGLCVRDFDDGAAYDRWAEQYHEYARILPTVKTARGCHVYVKLPADSTIEGTIHLSDGELRADGGIVLLPPSRHPSGTIYKWIIPPPEGDIPEIDPSEIGLAHPPKSVLAKVPDAVVTEGQRNATLTSLAGSMRRRGMTESSILAALREENTNRCTPPLDDAEVQQITHSVSRYQPSASPDDDTTHLTELGNAKRMVQTHGTDLHYVTLSRKWIVWDGRRWCPDETGEVPRRAKATIKAIYTEASNCEDPERRKKIVAWASKSESDKQIKAMISLAQSEPGIGVRPDAFDVDPWLLNCANGTLDLQTGSLRPHDRSDLFTRVLPTPYLPDAECPRWMQFLDTVTGGDQKLQGFLRRTAGYCLTGDISEQVLFILYGVGQNGKSKYLEMQRLLLGDYAINTPTKTFVVKKSSDATNDLARLHGARLVTAVEWEEGQRFAESLVKQVTGGDAITARFLHKEFFEFAPTFKLFLATNHKPPIRGGDLAMKRRVRLIPFTPTIPESKRDKHIVDKLKPELPGILRWAVEGCSEWRRDGLGEPPAVNDATTSYLAEMDVLGQFIEDRCVEREGIRVASSQLYTAYSRWCDRNGESAMSQTAFGLRLAERGFERKKIKGLNHWLGLGQAADSEEEEG